MKTRTYNASLAWSGLVAYVLAYDYYAIKNGKKTMSAGFAQCLDHRGWRIAVLAAWFMVTKHLAFNDVGRKYDPIQLAADKMRGRWHG